VRQCAFLPQRFVAVGVISRASGGFVGDPIPVLNVRQSRRMLRDSRLTQSVAAGSRRYGRVGGAFAREHPLQSIGMLAFGAGDYAMQCRPARLRVTDC
jgi:hypothetical protein